MLTAVRTLACLTLAATAAFAIDKDLADQMVQSSKNLERDALAVKASLARKAFNSADVTARIDAMHADVTKLQEIRKQFDATNPSLSQSDTILWQRVKDKIQIIEIFLQQKQSMATADLSKNRTQIRDLATGVALRARKLQESAATLRRG